MFAKHSPRFALSAVLLALSLTAQAQWGITPGFRTHQPDGWRLADENDPGDDGVNLLGRGPSLGIDYEFRLTQTRIQLLPEFNATLLQASGPGFEDSRSAYISTFLHAQFYFLDLGGDCDCPTFSKQGGWLQKGLFFRLSPGLTFQHSRIEPAESGLQPGEDGSDDLNFRRTAFSIGAGLGIDLGLSDLVTLTPLLEARHFPNAEWESLGEGWPPGSGYLVVDESSNAWQLHAGLRLGLRLNP